MKTLLTTLSAALTLTAGLVHAAPFGNDYDALLAGSADSDGSVMIRADGRACPLGAARKGIC